MQNDIIAQRNIVIAVLSVISCLFWLFSALNEAYDEAARNPQPRRRKRRRPSHRTRELDFGIIPVPVEIIALTHDKETAYPTL